MFVLLFSFVYYQIRNVEFEYEYLSCRFIHLFIMLYLAVFAYLYLEKEFENINEDYNKVT